MSETEMITVVVDGILYLGEWALDGDTVTVTTPNGSTETGKLDGEDAEELAEQMLKSMVEGGEA